MQVRQDDPAMAQDQAAALGQHDTLALMLEQRQASLPFHLLDLHRYGRLRQVQVLGCTGKTQVARHTFKDLNLANCYVSHMKHYLLDESNNVDEKLQLCPSLIQRSPSFAGPDCPALPDHIRIRQFIPATYFAGNHFIGTITSKVAVFYTTAKSP